MKNYYTLSIAFLITFSAYSQTFNDEFFSIEFDGDVEEITHGDIDGNGTPDLVLAVPQQDQLIFGLNFNTSFAPQFFFVSDGDYFQNNIELADYDGDGDLDVFASAPFEDRSIVWVNNFPELFEEETLADWDYDAIEFADLNGDGIMEAVIGHDDQVDIFDIPIGGGIELQTTIADRDPFRGGAGDINILDYDNDGDLDIAMIFDREGVILFEQTSTGQYSERQLFRESFNNNSLHNTDFNDDGIPDFVVQSDFSRNSSILLSDGGGYVEEEISNPIGPNLFTTVGDFDGNGN